MTRKTIKLTEEELRVVGAALMEMPYRVASPVIAEINRQLAEARDEDASKED